MRDLVLDLRSASRQQGVLRVMIVGVALVFAFVVLLIGQTSPWALVVLPVLGVICAVNPHTGFPTATMLYFLGVWGAGVEDVWTPWSLVAALCLLLLHTCCALAAGVPAQAVLPETLWRRYGLRVGVIAAGTTMCWILAALHQVLDVPGGVEAGLLGLLVLVVGLTLHYRGVTRRDEAGPVPEGRFTDRRDPTAYGMPQGPGDQLTSG